MIRSNSDYGNASVQCNKLHDRIADYRNELHGQGLSSEEIETVIGPMMSMYEQSQFDLACFDRIKGGDLSDFRDLRSLGMLLIAARIAKGQSKRDFAREVGVHESQVSRDERNEYQGISVERAAQLLDALGVKVEIKARVLHPITVDSFDMEPWMLKQNIEFEQESSLPPNPSLKNAA